MTFLRAASRGALLGALLSVPLLLSGCSGNSYELSLVPRGDSLSRVLLYRDSRGTEPAEEGEAAPAPSPEAERLAAVYAMEIPRPVDGEYRFEGTFTGAMPDDVGGAGRFERKQTSLGDLCVYVERFRGSYDLAEAAESRFANADLVASLLARWARTAGNETPLRDRLETAISQDLPGDLKNIAILSIALDAGRWDSNVEEFWIQLAQYGAERGYVDLDLILRGAAGGDSEDNVLLMLRKAIMLKLKLESEEGLLETWPDLADPERLVASVDRAVETSEAYQQYLRQASETEPHKDPIAGSEYLGSLIAEILGIHFAPADSLRVYLQCPSVPLKTNGEWLANERRLQWEIKLPHRDLNSANGPPDLCYASWTEADREFQQARFGRVLIDGQSLATYCGWRSSLSTSEGEDWDRFLEQIDPAENLEEVVAQFRFSAEAATLSPAARQSTSIKELFRRPPPQNP